MGNDTMGTAHGQSYETTDEELNGSTAFEHVSDEAEDDMFEMEEEESFQAMYEESLKSIQEGKVVQGEIVAIDKEYALVDIGYKSEGRIRIHEFLDAKGELSTAVGEKVDVVLVRKEGSDGDVILSREKAIRLKIWDEVEEAYKNGETVKGKITGRVKGGFSVDIGLRAFLPGSQADLRPVRNPDSLMGKELEFMIVKYGKRQENVVLSRRAVLEGERKTLLEETLKRLKEGEIFEGTVRNVTDYGLFVDLGGIDGLVHVTDMSWGRIKHPSEMAQVGDTITVMVLKYEQERQRVALGIKQLAPDPWSGAQEKYPVDSTVQGRVVGMKEYGVFVEVEEGVEGLVHVSEMSWTQKVKHPSQIVHTGDMVEAKVLKVDSDKRRISLSLKQLEPNPWDIVAEKFPVGSIIEGTVKNIADFGIFVGIYEGIDGLVHVSDLSWAKKSKKPSELYGKGDKVQAGGPGDRREQRAVLPGDQAAHQGSVGDASGSVPSRCPRGR